ncbi:hypothetical protein MNBD_ACTINO01-2576 [hydrothermal vent metagenome]|uniref:Uncharacterized protein n=1 Tax=hydrothermal vent metagenome TaxID=652676 RepID=A0A3B0SMZ9_9ZZZZ
MLTDVSKEDPKPGRWILPIVIVVLIGFTYVFVNALPPADITASTTTTAPTTTTTTLGTTTTSTLPTDILAFLAEVDRFEAAAADLLAELNGINEQWENQDIEYSEALDGFTKVHDDAQDLANQVTATTVPDPYPPAWPDTITASQELVVKAEAVIDGLKAPDDGTLRREAVQKYNDATVAFSGELDVVRGLTPSGG